MTPADLFLAHLPHIDKVVTHLGRRYHFRAEECQDFRSHVHLKMIEDDYAVIRKFQGRCSLKTYLTTVVSNLMKDFQNHLWGKWRPSAEAERVGPTAVLLERLLVRDGYWFDEAVQILQVNCKVGMSWQELERMAARLPSRVLRRIEGEEGLRDLPAPNERADSRVFDEERAAAHRKALAALEEARKSLPEEEQLILKMQGDGFKVADIARILRLDQKQLYRRILKIHKDLRQMLEDGGIHGPEDDGDPEDWEDDEDPED